MLTGFEIELLILFIVLPALFVAVFIPLFFRHNYHKNFVIAHSVKLDKIKRINKKYPFKRINSLDQRHTYDNEHYYNNISCKAFLTAFINANKKKVTTELYNAKDNANKFIEYSKEINDLNIYNDFDCSTEGYNEKLLKKIETKMEESLKLHPTINFGIKISLYYVSMGGNYRHHKTQYFYSSEINTLIGRINNKRGSFYNDPQIWNDLCMVERGKVSNKMRFYIYQRDHYRCCMCGWSGRNRNSGLEIDHIYPISKGGKSTIENLQTLCHRCNKRKGDSVNY